jgi:hypothetical protein
MEKGRRPTVLNTCLKWSLFVLHLFVKRGQAALYPPTEQAPLLLAWKTWTTQMEKTISVFKFLFSLPSQKRWQEFLHDPIDAMFLSFHPTHIYIYIYS